MISKRILTITSFIFLISTNSFGFPFSYGTPKNAPEQKEATPLMEEDQIDQNNFYPIATLQGLDKITAKTSILEIKVGEEKEFGDLIINVQKCWKSSPDKRPENKILLEVFRIENKGKKQIFHGWMLSSSPSISGIEHPIYDITAIACK